MEEELKKCFRCGTPLDPKNSKLKHICRKCFEDPKTKHKGQLTQKANKKNNIYKV